MTESLPHQAIYRRWRAQTFAQIVGQGAVVETLRNAVRTSRVSHAILFVGPRGTGKTSLARILAKALNCTDLRDGDPCDACPSCTAIREGRALDLVEIDAASNRGIEAIRELRERINYAPTDLRRKVYILDEAHQITKDAWNALLKSLEEPPEFVTFMFASTEPGGFPPAILSRLQRFDVRRLSTDEIEGKLGRILEADGRQADPAAVRLIARLAAGGMRDAESMLDQLLSAAPDRLDADTVRDLLGLAPAESVEAFVAALAAGDIVGGIATLDGLEERGRDLRAFAEQVIEAVRDRIGGRVVATDGLGLADLVRVARRLAAIDPGRAGIGGIRLQLELCLLADTGQVEAPRAHVPAAPSPVASPRPAAARAAPIDPAPTRSLRADPPPPVEHGLEPILRGAEPAAPSVEPAVRARSRNTAAATPPVDRPVGAGIAPPAVSADLATLRDRWPEVVARISAHPAAKPLITVCRPISVEDGLVTLGFPEDKGFLRDVAERRRPTLEAGIGEVLGRTVAVRCIATNLDLVPEVPADAEAEYVLAQARRIFGEGPEAAGTAGEIG